MNSIKNSLSDIIEIMSIVAERLKDPNEAEQQNEAQVIKKLIGKGFALEDIDTAMNLVSLITTRPDPIIKLHERKQLSSGQNSGIRYLHESEALRLTAKAQQALIDMVETGQISSLHFERALEYIMQSDLRNIDAVKLNFILCLTLPESEQHILASRTIASQVRLN